MKKSLRAVIVILSMIIYITAVLSGCDSPIKPTSKQKHNSSFNFPVEGVRPYAVMIDNQGTRCLPQGGLNKAQIIYEILAEGGITRYMALFWDENPSLVGPVRSSRHYFLDYAMENDAIYVHFGWSPMAKRDISRFNINNINGVAYGSEIFWNLTNDPGNWQDSYTSMEKIKSFAQKAGYSTTSSKKLVFNYNDEDAVLSDGLQANSVDITYNSNYNCGYRYDLAKKDYKRIRLGKPQIERVSKKQLRAKNIIIQTVNNYGVTGDDKGRQELGNVGEGKGWFITRGKAIEITWSKESRSAPTNYMDKNGNSITLNPGQTWIQIVPPEGKIVIK